MSLKWFHILFIFFASMLMVALEFWGVKVYYETGDAGRFWTLPVGFAGGVALILYAGWFFSTYIRTGRL